MIIQLSYNLSNLLFFVSFAILRHVSYLIKALTLSLNVEIKADSVFKDLIRLNHGRV